MQPGNNVSTMPPTANQYSAPCCRALFETGRGCSRLLVPSTAASSSHKGAGSGRRVVAPRSSPLGHLRAHQQPCLHLPQWQKRCYQTVSNDSHACTQTAPLRASSRARRLYRAAGLSRHAAVQRESEAALRVSAAMASRLQFAARKCTKRLQPCG
ncbi:uncharacterized protein CC84DRAFT_1180524 [Paraphaeosphaeria sporulosa]|uniref:Uncharacterized protein n=1 Tax=Paraphaeosphaeria sporulosa TaxID=1460663 RepID=A0A177BZC8_9PLEO|nr:uncharacterized protein CC84DRAFT_1180524 [Paraphaeosphaeria sporulosa]OAG00516.1 hypothetical protein CC84DRAFT_1180524 [Paraphaeosphaeria sporulosa]